MTKCLTQDAAAFFHPKRTFWKGHWKIILIAFGRTVVKLLSILQHHTGIDNILAIHWPLLLSSSRCSENAHHIQWELSRDTSGAQSVHSKNSSLNIWPVGLSACPSEWLENPKFLKSWSFEQSQVLYIPDWFLYCCAFNHEWQYVKSDVKAVGEVVAGKMRDREIAFQNMI